MRRFLVVNDDGIGSAGISALVAALARMEDAEVYVAAPSSQQSAKSHAITVAKDVAHRRIHVNGASVAYELDATPADCVMWAIPWFRERGTEFDFVVSGINMGHNLGISQYYSATVGAAREGAINGVRSIALSVDSREAKHFDYICSILPDILKMSASLGTGTILSINAPDIPIWKMKGFRIAEAAPRGVGVKFSFVSTGSGVVRFKHTRLESGRPAFAGAEPELRYDTDCVRNGYAAVTPLVTQCTDRVALNKLKGLYRHEDALLIIVDAQENIVSGVTGAERFRENMTKLARCACRLDLAVAVAELYGFGRTLRDVSDAAGRVGRAETVLRREYSVWGSGDFVRLMDNTSVRKIIIAGLETHGAVLQTAAESAKRGYEVTVLEDCCASRSGHDHKMAIERMRDAGCRVMTLRAGMLELMHSANHPAADAIRRILD